MSADNLGDRMKGYENISRTYLTRRMPAIIRVDGKAFHSLTKNMSKPWDDGLIDAMIYTTQYLCENIQGAKLGYVQSDEISILLTDFDKFTTSAWFDKNVQKMVSVAASMATLAFNKKIREHYPDKEGLFDGRTYVVPEKDVANYFLWRQQDATRNSIQMLGRGNFSHKQLENLNCSQIQDKLMLEKGVNWNDTPTHKKRGAAVRRDGEVWVTDMEMPIITQDRNYVNDLLIPEEE